MQSLLGQFYTRIKGSQEDIASEGLAYILQRSKSSRNVLNKIIKLECGLDFDEINYLTQNIGEKLERPDVSGYDVNGKNVVILETKFWASLTDNQPLGYIELLSENSVMIFICPSLRVRPVFDEIQKRIFNANAVYEITHMAHFIRLPENKNVIVKTWNEILGSIRFQLIQDNDQVLLSDIDQIIGLCETIDNNSFLPFQNEDFSPSFAKRINSFYDLTDKVVDELIKLGLANINKLKSTPQKYGYTRYFKMESYGISLNVKFNFWERIADTPFWLSIKDDITNGANWIQSDRLRTLTKRIASKSSIITYESNNKELFYPIFPLVNKTEDIVVTDIVNQIINLKRELELQNNSEIKFANKGQEKAMQDTIENIWQQPLFDKPTREAYRYFTENGKDKDNTKKKFPEVNPDLIDSWDKK